MKNVFKTLAVVVALSAGVYAQAGQDGCVRSARKIDPSVSGTLVITNCTVTSSSSMRCDVYHYSPTGVLWATSFGESVPRSFCR
jgi:hypothetical protein